MDQEKEIMIKTESLTFRYADPVEQEEGASSTKPLIIKGVDLSIEAGSIVAILGHNGSGKSTLAKMFNAVLLPEGGKVYVANMDTEDDDLLFKIRQTAGMVFQNPDNQIVATIVEDDVAFGPENLGIESSQIRSRVDEALKTVGMHEFRDRAPSQLSGGQKQRVAIAGIIAMEPRCIILDEATAMLDPSGRKEVMETVMRLNREQGITVIMITHFMSEAAQADRVVVMDGGKIALDGTPREIFHKVEELHEVGLDVPDATELAHQLQAAGISLDANVLTVDECTQSILTALQKGDS